MAAGVGSSACERDSKSRMTRTVGPQGRTWMWSWMLAAWFLHICIGLASAAGEPYIIEHPEGDTTLEGNTEVLLCEALGEAPLSYQWLKDDLPVNEYSEGGRRLYLNDVGRDDAGEYRCRVRNSIGTVMSKSATLHVTYLSNFEGSDSTATATAGQPIILSCPNIDGYPEPVISWQLDDASAVAPNRVVTMDQRLAILDPSAADQGEYRCRAANPRGSQDLISPSITLTVQGTSPPSLPLTIAVSPGHTSVIQGETIAKMECIVNARPLTDLEVTWLQDGVEVQSGGTELFEYQIRSPAQSDQGVYTCQASLPGQAPVSASANLTLFIPPSFTAFPEDQTISSVGSDVAIPCSAAGNPPPLITWFVNTVDVTSLGLSRFQVLDTGTLQIISTEAVDHGMYQCVISNEAGEDIKDTWLQVREIAPSFLTAPVDATVIQGQEASLQCQADGAPKPTIAWLKDGMIPVSDDLILSTGDLYFASTLAADTGDYTCIADNGVGTINATARLTVYLPTVIESPPQDSEVQLGGRVVLDCAVSHDPSVTVSVDWYHNGAPLDVAGSPHLNQLPAGSLENTQARREDKGLYECRVTSVAGGGRRNATLTILELPQKPTNLMAQISASDSRTIELSWVAPFDGNSPLLRYIIQRKEDESAFTEIDSNVDPSLTMFPVSGLVPSRSYSFKVTAENLLGRGEISDPSQVVHLPEEPPDEAPDNVVTSASSTTSIIVEWQAPPEDTWNGPLKGYILRYKLYGYTSSPDIEVNITSVRQTSYTLSSLNIWTRYEIRVAAYNRAGVGTFSRPVEQRTREGAPSEAPGNVQATVLNSTAIDVQWQAPDPQTINGINQGYKLHAVEVGQNSLRTEVLVTPDPSSPNQQGFIGGLKKYTEYRVSVLCFTSPGDGPASPEIPLRTQEDRPGPVGNLMLKEVLDTSLKVQWTAPAESNGVIREYAIKWKVYNTTSTAQPISLPPNQLEYQVTGLTATTMYSLVMWASTSVGRGPPTETVFSSGVPPQLPQPPTKLTISNTQARSVNVRFRPGFSGHSSISAWLVEAQVGAGPDWLALYQHSDPDSTGFQIPDLIPYMDYRFRIRAENVVGASQPSEPTPRIQTLQDIPEVAPPEVTVRAFSETALRVRWVPLLDSQWSGEPIGYHIYWQEVSSSQDGDDPSPPLLSHNLPDPYMGEYIISGLEEWTEYGVQVEAYNQVGTGPISLPLVERTSDTVPSSGPTNVQTNATGPFTIDVSWDKVPPIDQNGAILGYKILYQSGRAQSEQESLEVAGEESRAAMLTGLLGYTHYTLSVLAYTRMGDGTQSDSVIVQTKQSVPGPPTGILFPTVTSTSATITWQPPTEPNGVIQKYRVSYVQDSFPDTFKQMQEVGQDQTYTAPGLFPDTYYLFGVTAMTQKGWGQEATALVYTTSDRTAPTAPSKPSVDHIQSRQVRVSWTPGSDGNGPLRFYTIQIKEGSAGSFQDRATNVDPAAISFIVERLSPYTAYQFRLKAHNDIGESPYSVESDVISTEQDVPSGAPSIQEVVPITPTSVRVAWTAPPADTHNGPLLGYRLSYTALPDSTPLERATSDPALLDFELRDLTRYQDYEVKVCAYNAEGQGPYSLVSAVYVGVATPSEAPGNILGSSGSASSLHIAWDALPEDAQNGGLQGYKITYWETPNDSRTARETPVRYTRTFPSQDTQATLDGLKCFTQYSLTVLGFNSAGDGPASDEITGTTDKSDPGIPAAVSFHQVRMTSLNLTWLAPELPCGIVTGYQVYYESMTPIDDEISTITVEINGPLLEYSVEKLGEFASYVFRVRARTEGRTYGPYQEANITTGPQAGAPDPPRSLTLEQLPKGFRLRWTSPEKTGASELVNYIIDSQEEGRSEWETQTDKVGPEASSYTVPYGNLKTSTNYKFRIMAENGQSISFPKATSDFRGTPAGKATTQPDPGLTMKMFYEEWWFLIIVGLVVLIVLILITATLCMLGKSRLYKERKAHKRVSQEERFGPDDAIHSPAFEMEQNNGTSGRGAAARGRGRGGNRNGIYSRTNSYTRPPPRPSPGSIEYSEEEESKHYETVHRQPNLEQEETSSLTEKADLQSQTDSQSSYDSKGSDSDIEYTDDPHSFANHYASVPGGGYPTHSWRRQKGPKAYSYTDSESDMHSIHVNGLAGMPAGSRAPLHGFSSFV